jgi:peroxiredoxin
MHKSRINIFDKPKIMINSQDAYFNIKRHCAQVEIKNVNIFSKKNHYADLAEMEKHFYKKIYIITLCNCWNRSYP